MFPACAAGRCSVGSTTNAGHGVGDDLVVVVAAAAAADTDRQKYCSAFSALCVF